MVKKGTYETYGIYIEYEYHVDTGDWQQPPHYEVEIKSMKYGGIDIQDLLINVANEWYENVIERIEEYESEYKRNSF
tara:strand:- start:118 stop:348 length:231 start_codon:yes stop_codon:yes gene_type:complete